MADAGFFRGTTTDQDNRFSDKEKKLLKTMKFEDILAVKVDMSKVKVDVLKPWITKRVYEILKMEDDVVVEFIFNHLEEKLYLLSSCDWNRNRKWNSQEEESVHVYMRRLQNQEDGVTPLRAMALRRCW